MSEFKVIETQEQFDEMLGDRLKREREASEKKYEAYTTPDDLQALKDSYEARIKTLEDTAADTQKALEERDQKIAEDAKDRADLEKTRIAYAAGLDIKYADRLRGENAEEWKADAKALAKDFAAAHQAAPLGSNEPEITEKHTPKQSFKDWADQVL